MAVNLHDPKARIEYLGDLIASLKKRAKDAERNVMPGFKAIAIHSVVANIEKAASLEGIDLSEEIAFFHRLYKLQVSVIGDTITSLERKYAAHTSPVAHQAVSVIGEPEPVTLTVTDCLKDEPTAAGYDITNLNFAGGTNAEEEN